MVDRMTSELDRLLEIQAMIQSGYPTQKDKSILKEFESLKSKLENIIRLEKSYRNQAITQNNKIVELEAQVKDLQDEKKLYVSRIRQLQEENDQKVS